MAKITFTLEVPDDSQVFEFQVWKLKFRPPAMRIVGAGVKIDCEERDFRGLGMCDWIESSNDNTVLETVSRFVEHS